MARFLCLVGWYEFSTRLMRHNVTGKLVGHQHPPHPGLLAEAAFRRLRLAAGLDEPQGLFSGSAPPSHNATMVLDQA